jgi:diaminopimelate decarboxylase
MDIQPYIDTAECMIDFTAEIKNKYGYEISVINLGGGFGVKYIPEHEEINIDNGIKLISEHIHEKCNELKINVPKIIFEPGRSIVANAGVTLYTIGTNKNITEYKTYISIDGSMGDNPRYALYKSPYTIVAANRMNEECVINATIAGRCCESGDIIQENVKLPNVQRGDILAVLVTGAYNYSMAMNYNRLPRPAMIFVNDGESRITIKRETYEDLMRNEL